MLTFRDYILSSEISDEDHAEFVYMCSDWELFCTTLTKMDKLETIKLMKYLMKERNKSKLLLKRCIGRFNRLNQLTKEVLISCEKAK